MPTVKNKLPFSKKEFSKLVSEYKKFINLKTEEYLDFDFHGFTFRIMMKYKYEVNRDGDLYIYIDTSINYINTHNYSYLEIRAVEAIEEFFRSEINSISEIEKVDAFFSKTEDNKQNIIRDFNKYIKPQLLEWQKKTGKSLSIINLTSGKIWPLKGFIEEIRNNRKLLESFNLPKLIR